MKALVGSIMLGVGILVAGASGLCSLVFLGAGLTESGGLLTVFPLVVMFGGIPFAIGLGLFFGGRALLRQARQESEGAGE